MSRWAMLRLVAMILMTLSFFLAGTLMGHSLWGMVLLIGLGALLNVAAHLATIMDIYAGRW